MQNQVIPRRSLPTSVSLWMLIFAISPALLAQDPETDRAADPVLRAWRGNLDVMACDQCHYTAKPGLQQVDTAYSRQNELSFWLANDKHAIARRRVEPLTEAEVLEQAKMLMADLEEMKDRVNLRETVLGWLGASNVLSRSICDKLGYDLTDKSDTSFRDNCLTCHGGYRENNALDATNFAAGQPGISCNFCHQNGADQRWIETHGSRLKRDRWRRATPQIKAQGGMRDLVTTSKQADLCFDCHIGNRKKNQFVTHEMYAAGHPPLPSVELQTFCDQMPQHWRSAGEASEAVPAAERPLFHQLNYPGVDQPNETFWDTRKILIGALAARKKNLDLIIDSSELDLWTDYSLYDCTACHHELKSQSRRQDRQMTTTPGRPRQTEWMDPQLMQLDRFLPADAPEISRLEQKLAKSFAARPFGDEQQVVRDASELRQQIETAIANGEQATINRKTALTILHGLLDTPVDRMLTYDAARQVVWAIRAISKELSSRGEALPPEAERLIGQLNQPTTGDGNTGIATKLPAGRSEFIYKQGLSEDLERRSVFDPDQLGERFQAIQAALATAAK